MSQPQRESDMPMPDEDNTFVLIEVDSGPIDPREREQLERSRQRWRQNRLDGRCSIKPEILKKMRQAAERLGVSEGDLLCEGFDLFLQKHRDKLGDLLDPQPPSDAPSSENGPPSA